MTEEKLATGKTRYYKVRAYRKVNGKTVYGSFSKVKKQSLNNKMSERNVSLLAHCILPKKQR